MDVFTIAHASFDAGHFVANSDCDREGHGHSWRVAVEVSGQLDPQAGRLRGAVGLEAGLEKLVSELNGRSLNAMMPGAVPTPNGVALWIMERLSLAFPKVTSVTVEMGSRLSGRVTRQLRE